MFEDFTSFVVKNYQDSSKIVEVGVGHRNEIAIDLKTKLPNTEVIVTDTNRSWVRLHTGSTVKAVVDDVVNPTLAIYDGAKLVYSIQPPIELVPSLVRLVKQIGADLLVAPVMDEQEAFHGREWKRVTMRGRTIGWLLARSGRE